ncbi:hypothetical protein SprV_0200703000 [Sparganum proliferum]
MNGSFIDENSAKIKCWCEQLQHLLNSDEKPITPLLSSAAEFYHSPVYAVSYNLLARGGITDTVQRWHNNKETGDDGIPIKIYKSYVETLTLWLYEVTEQSWVDEIIPDNLGFGIFGPEFNK